MDHLPLVSVITIVYNGEKHIEHTIKSVLGQSYSNIEYIIIDGGSTDGTLSIIEKYKKNIHILISEKDKGISDAFNKGIKLATGEIIGIINADDWYEEQAVEDAVRSITGYHVVFGDLQLWKNGSKDYIYKGNYMVLNREMAVNHPTVFVRTECYMEVGIFDVIYKCAMDYDMMLRLKINGYKFNYVGRVMANMRMEGLSDTRWLLGCRETLIIKNKHFAGKRLAHRLYFYKHITAIALLKFLERIKMKRIVRFYRSAFSTVEKKYN